MLALSQFRPAGKVPKSANFGPGTKKKDTKQSFFGNIFSLLTFC
jgi:hypothetical protein